MTKGKTEQKYILSLGNNYFSPKTITTLPADISNGILYRI